MKGMGQFSSPLDYLTERMKYQGNERRLQEENELLRLEQGELRNTLQNVIAKAESDIKHTANTTEKKADEVVQKYRRQAQVQNENLLIIQVKATLRKNIQEQYKRIQEMYLTKIKTLEGQLDKLQKKYKELRTRRNLEIEGYKTDIGQIRKKTRIYDEYLHRVKKLIDENPARAIELAKSQELNVDPIKEQLEGMEARLGKTKAETNYATVPQEHEVVEPEKEEAKDQSANATTRFYLRLFLCTIKGKVKCLLHCNAIQYNDNAQSVFRGD
eukprot:TRINITY_DN105551_c5_g1_i1.p4 TRINITY_DN105551_c5_g1~~TRINITY_DN105551_c5_g1_i1.p4  ORF type:complete len:271 (+),score=38.37 TRINITY_DN105551_c5_g1_i1:1490-2302(+)